MTSHVSGVEAAATASAGVAARYANEASMSILKRAIDTAAESSAALVDTMVSPTPQALPPVGSIGARVDVRI